MYSSRRKVLNQSLGRLTCTNVVVSELTVVKNTEITAEEQHLDNNKSTLVTPRSCILDGQQRFTTLTLVLAATRDVLQKYYSVGQWDDDRSYKQKTENLVSTINGMLFVDVPEIEILDGKDYKNKHRSEE
jgi:hypothetical protein